jgi:hypothetical protein
MTLAERKADQKQAPVYYLTWRSPVRDGKLKAFHTLDIPFVFENVDLATAMTGAGQDRYALQDRMSAAPGCSHSAEGTQLLHHCHHVEVMAHGLDLVIRNFDHLTSPNLNRRPLFTANAGRWREVSRQNARKSRPDALLTDL